MHTIFDNVIFHNLTKATVLGLRYLRAHSLFTPSDPPLYSTMHHSSTSYNALHNVVLWVHYALYAVRATYKARLFVLRAHYIFSANIRGVFHAHRIVRSPYAALVSALR